MDHQSNPRRTNDWSKSPVMRWACGGLPMSDVLLISVSGNNQPGITDAFTQAFATSDATLLDARSTVQHNIFALTVLVRLGEEENAAKIEQALKRKAQEL